MLINRNNNSENINDLNENRYLMQNQNYILNNNINNRILNNLYNQNNMYNFNQLNDNIYENKSKMNFSNYNNLNNNNMNINNIYQQNILFKSQTQGKKQRKENYYQKNNIINQNTNFQNNFNYIRNNHVSNYQNSDYNLNQNNIGNINNNNYSNMIIPNNMNINYYQNSNQSNLYNNNNNQARNNYQMINNIPYLINSDKNIRNKNQSKKGVGNKQKRQNLNLLSNEEIAKQAYILVKDQNGCRYLQKRVENNKDLVPSIFFPSILGHFDELSNDQFGNYYIKIIIKYLSNDMIYKLISLIHPSFSKIGTNQFGTKVIQYLIELLNDEKNFILFVDKIIPHVVNLINDLNGIHIIQKLLTINHQYTQLIYNTIFNNIELISVTRDGSNFIIKKLFDFIDDNNLTLLLNSINQKLDVIITDQFGNYIIQNILKKCNILQKYQIIENITKNLVKFSNQKFSSNVVEKCLESEMKENLINEVLKGNNFELILLNEYGNYVIQKALNKADKNKQNLLLKSLVPLVDKLQKKPFGQKLLQKLFVNYPKLSILILNC